MVNRRIDYSVLVSKDLWNRSDSLIGSRRDAFIVLSVRSFFFTVV